MMDDGARLLVVPPAEIIHLHAPAFQGRAGFLDLGLKAAVGQRKGKRMLKKDFHGKTADLDESLEFQPKCHPKA